MHILVFIVLLVVAGLLIDHYLVQIKAWIGAQTWIEEILSIIAVVFTRDKIEHDEYADVKNKRGKPVTSNDEYKRHMRQLEAIVAAKMPSVKPPAKTIASEHIRKGPGGRLILTGGSSGNAGGIVSIMGGPSRGHVTRDMTPYVSPFDDASGASPFISGEVVPGRKKKLDVVHTSVFQNIGAGSLLIQQLMEHLRITFPQANTSVTSTGSDGQKIVPLMSWTNSVGKTFFASLTVAESSLEGLDIPRMMAQAQQLIADSEHDKVLTESPQIGYSGTQDGGAR